MKRSEFTLVTEFPFRPYGNEDGGALFPLSINNNPMVLYHGASSVGAESIENQGLRSRLETVRQADVDQVVNLYKSVRWSGLHTGGLAVLACFSAFDAAQGLPVYLAESENRALLFATADFACGERARAVFYSVGDLLKLI